MISDSDRFFGAVFSTIVNGICEPVSIEKLRTFANGFYLVNAKTPILIKYATSRFSPWQFNFLRVHQEQQKALFEEYGQCITCLCCGKDGIAALTFQELRSVLDDSFDDQESVVVRRRRGEMYGVSGRDGVYKRKVARKRLIDHLEIENRNPMKSI